MSTSSIKRQIRRFHVVVVQRTSKKCSKKSDARAELFWSFNLLFFEVVNAVTGQQWIWQTMADEHCEVTSYWWKTCPTVEVTWSFTYFSLCTDAPSPHKKGRGCLHTDRLHILGLKPRSRHFKSSMLLFKENHSNHFSKPWLQKLEWFTVVLLLYFGNIISISVGETSQFKVKPVIILKS